MKVTLKSARVNAKVKVEYIRQKVGVTAQTIYLWEEGRTLPPVDKALIMCNEYNVDINDVEWVLKK